MGNLGGGTPHRRGTTTVLRPGGPCLHARRGVAKTGERLHLSSDARALIRKHERPAREPRHRSSRAEQRRVGVRVPRHRHAWFPPRRRPAAGPDGLGDRAATRRCASERTRRRLLGGWPGDRHSPPGSDRSHVHYRLGRGGTAENRRFGPAATWSGAVQKLLPTRGRRVTTGSPTSTKPPARTRLIRGLHRRAPR